MDMENRLCEMLLLSRGDHQLRRRKPAVAVLAPDLDLVDAASEWPSQCLSQPGDRQQYGEGVSVNEHQARVRINRPDRGERKDVVRTFEHPAPTPGRLMLQMLQKPPMKAIGLVVAGFVEPAAIARDAVGCVEAETRKDMRGDLGAFLRRCGVDRVHAPEIRREQCEQAQLPGYPLRPQIPVGASFERVRRSE